METVSTRLVVDAAKLMHSGLGKRLSVEVGMIQPLTDDDEILKAKHKPIDLQITLKKQKRIMHKVKYNPLGSFNVADAFQFLAGRNFPNSSKMDFISYPDCYGYKIPEHCFSVYGVKRCT
jgi:hypothetical protein